MVCVQTLSQEIRKVLLMKIAGSREGRGKMEKLERSDVVRFGGTIDYRVASNPATGQAIDFYHDVGEDKSWYVYRSNRHTSRVVNTLDEAIELWNKE